MGPCNPKEKRTPESGTEEITVSQTNLKRKGLRADEDKDQQQNFPKVRVVKRYEQCDHITKFD